MPRAPTLLCGVTAIILAWPGAVQAQPAATTSTSAATASIDDGTGAYRTQRYRNLFAERLGRSPQETHARIERTFQQLFHGDGQEQRVYFETGANGNGPLAYITDWANNDVRTEGMSYGMMIAVQLGKKREFDALWNWSKTYMLTTDPANPSHGYFAWSMSTDGTPRAVGAAPDGEEYYAMALYFAARRWGNGKGIYDYQREADIILRGMRHHPVVTATPPFRIHPGDAPFVEPDTPWPSPNNRHEAEEARKAGKPWPPQRPHREPRPVTVGPMVDEAHAMVRFVPETVIPGTNPSYHLPAFYELWARWGPREDRAFWARAAAVSRDFFVKTADPATGLGPDRADFDGTPLKNWDGSPGAFGYDSWRTIRQLVEQGPAPAGAQRPRPALPGRAGHSSLCRPLHAGRQAAVRPSLDGHAGGGRRRQPGGRAGADVRRLPARAVGHARARRRAALLRRHVVFDEHDAPGRRVPRDRRRPQMTPTITRR